MSTEYVLGLVVDGDPRRVPRVRAARAGALLMTFNGWFRSSLFFAVVAGARRSRSASTCFGCSRATRSRCRARSDPSSAACCGCAACATPASRRGSNTPSRCWCSARSALVVTYLIQRTQAHCRSTRSTSPNVGARSRSTRRRASRRTPTGSRTSPETTMSYLTQMAGLAWHNFTSAAVGIGVALAVARGLTRQRAADASATSGSIWSAASSTCCCRSRSSSRSCSSRRA